MRYKIIPVLLESSVFWGDSINGEVIAVSGTSPNILRHSSSLWPCMNDASSYTQVTLRRHKQVSNGVHITILFFFIVNSFYIKMWVTVSWLLSLKMAITIQCTCTFYIHVCSQTEDWSFNPHTHLYVCQAPSIRVSHHWATKLYM